MAEWWYRHAIHCEFFICSDWASQKGWIWGEYQLRAQQKAWKHFKPELYSHFYIQMTLKVIQQFFCKALMFCLKLEIFAFPPYQCQHTCFWVNKIQWRCTDLKHYQWGIQLCVLAGQKIKGLFGYKHKSNFLSPTECQKRMSCGGVFILIKTDFLLKIVWALLSYQCGPACPRQQFQRPVSSWDTLPAPR